MSQVSVVYSLFHHLYIARKQYSHFRFSLLIHIYVFSLSHNFVMTLIFSFKYIYLQTQGG